MSSRADHILEGFEETASHQADRVALVMPDGHSMTYAELDDQATRLAGYLRSVGVEPGDRVGFTLPKSLEAVTTILGALKCGAAYVPSDWTAPAQRGRAIMSDCEVKVLVLHPQCLGVLDGWPGSRPEVLVVGNEATGSIPRARSWDAALRGSPGQVESFERDQDDLAYVLYTSGSTGLPKGVRISHKNALSFIEWCSETFLPEPEDRFSSHAPFHFDLSILDLHVALKHGASVHLIPDDLGKSPKELVDFVVQHDITVWYSTPSTLSIMLEYGGLDTARWHGPRLALFAGEVFPAKHLRRIVDIWPRSRWFNLYGPTETNVCSYHEVILEPSNELTDPPPIGVACGDHTILRLLDGEGNDVRPGSEGVLWVSGDCVFQGYWNRPEEDEAAFKEIDGERWYNTRDIVRPNDEGELVYVGRSDRMVKRRGYRIELGEIESALYRHEGIEKVAAVAKPDEEQGIRIVACCVARGGEALSMIEMKQFCHQQLPAYMVPDAFLWLTSLPLTSTGKTDYQRLSRDTAS